MDDIPGIELSILEGMDENLLAQLHRVGIRTRAELEARISTRDARRVLSREVGTTSRRLEVLHHLNFLLPEERVERTLEIERRLLDRSDHVDQEFRQLWRAVTGVAIALLAGILIAVLFLRPPGGDTASEETRVRVAELEQVVRALRPVGIRHAEQRILAGVRELGPAPGWNGPLSWTPEHHRQIQDLLGPDEDTLSRRAVSLALLRLADLENAPPESLSWADRSRAAASLVREFPVVRDPATLWDRAAVLLRTRCRSRSLGLAPLDPDSPDLVAAFGWEWTGPGFLTCEEMVSRLEGLPLRQDALPVWSESLVQIRSAADQGGDHLANAAEAQARDVWLRRAELEYAVVVGILGNSNLLPYHRSSPREFLRQRRGFLNGVLSQTSGSAWSSLGWLVVEYEEADRLLGWLENHEQSGNEPDPGWMEAMVRIEAARAASPLEPGPEVERRVRDMLSPEVQDPWSEPVVRWEAGLRPVLMETRAAIEARSSGSAP